MSNAIDLRLNIGVFIFCRTFNVPPVPFAGNLASDGDILVLYDE
jgi:hypothetical protein